MGRVLYDRAGISIYVKEAYSDKQWEFAKNVSALLQWIERRGWKVTFGDAYRDSRCNYGSKSSKHRRRLAIDLNLFVNGIYQTQATEEYLEVARQWESMPHCRSGARFNDINHFEYSDAEWQDEVI